MPTPLSDVRSRRRSEGLWFMEVLGLSPFSAKHRLQLVETILSIADGAPLTTVDPK